MLGFVGRFEHSLDDKGRLTLPVRFRVEFAESAHLTQHYEGCLALWTASEWTRQLREMQERVRSDEADQRNRARIWGGGALDVDVDRQGRFVVPARARAYADLDGEVLILGAIDHLEFWDPGRFDQLVGPAESYFNGSALER